MNDISNLFIMKNYLFFLLGLSVLLVYSGCNKDDDDGVSNKFVLNGESYALSKGYIEDYGANGNGSYDFDITLTSSDINYSDAQGLFSGTGDFIYLDLNSSLASGLVEGTYSFSSTRDAFTLVDGTVGTNYDLMVFTGEDFSVVGGSVDIEIKGNETYISWNLTISNGTMVTGEFQGILREI
jgi:hypothetical protein